MNGTKFTKTKFFIVTATAIFLLSALTISAFQTNDLFDGQIFNREEIKLKYNFALAPQINVATLDELYAAVNNAANAGSQINLAAGIYTLSVNAPGGAARPNGGRLELQENMMLRGVSGNRGAVIIDASGLPTSSYNSEVPNSGAIRMGKGTNAVEWLTVRNAVSGGAGIIVHLSAVTR